MLTHLLWAIRQTWRCKRMLTLFYLLNLLAAGLLILPLSVAAKNLPVTVSQPLPDRP